MWSLTYHLNDDGVLFVDYSDSHLMTRGTIAHHLSHGALRAVVVDTTYQYGAWLVEPPLPPIFSHHRYLPVPGNLIISEFGLAIKFGNYYNNSVAREWPWPDFTNRGVQC